MVPPQPSPDVLPVSSRGRRLRTLRAIVGVGVLFACAALLAGRVDLAAVLSTLRRCDPRPVGLAALLNLTLNMAVRTERWRVLLWGLPPEVTPRVTPPRRRELLSLYLAHLAANNLLPGRVGEALRVAVLRGRNGYPVSGLVAVLLLEKGVETLSMGLLAAAMLIWLPPPPALAAPLRWMFGLGMFCVALAFVIAGAMARRGRRLAGGDLPLSVGDTAGDTTGASDGADTAAAGPGGAWGRIGAFLLRLFAAVRLLHSPRLWAVALLWSLLSIGIDVAMIGLCLRAVGVTVGVGAWLLVFFSINLAIAVPTTPGQIGVLEASAVLALAVLGVPHSAALAFAILYHAAHVLPTTACGAWPLRGAALLGASPQAGVSGGGQGAHDGVRPEGGAAS